MALVSISTYLLLLSHPDFEDKGPAHPARSGDHLVSLVIWHWQTSPVSKRRWVEFLILFIWAATFWHTSHGRWFDFHGSGICCMMKWWWWWWWWCCCQMMMMSDDDDDAKTTFSIPPDETVNGFDQYYPAVRCLILRH